MICDVCKKKIVQKMRERIPFTWEYLIYVQERIQWLIIQASDKRTTISRYFNDEDIERLKEILDSVEILIGKIVPYIEGD